MNNEGYKSSIILEKIKKEGKLEDWIYKMKKYKIPEMDNFITGVERDVEAIKTE